MIFFLLLNCRFTNVTAFEEKVGRFPFWGAGANNQIERHHVGL